MACKHGLDRDLVTCIQCEDEERARRSNQAVPVDADELAALRLDAARYRFIRDVPYTENIRLIMRDQCNAIMDAAIDAAMDTERMSAGFGAALDLTRKAVES